jgi:hypothetical protein
MKKLILLLLALLGTTIPTVRAQDPTPTPDWVNPKNPGLGAICDGNSHPLSTRYRTLAAAQAVYPFITSLTQQIDYAALKLASNSALGADGSEHGSNAALNKPIYLPAGTCYIGSDTWTIRNADGIQMQGAGARATQITGSGIVLQFDGLWYSRLSDFAVVTTSSSATVALDIDGNVPGHPYDTRSVQGNNFIGLLVGGGGSTYAVAMCRQGGGGAQCSENTWINFHGSNASFAVYYQNGYNALDNLLLGGDMQNFAQNGVYLVAGSISVYRISFESTRGYSQVRQGGCDITANAAGTGDSIVVDGIRSQDMCIYLGGASQPMVLHGITQQIAQDSWSAATGFALDTITRQTGADGNLHIYAVTTAGTSGGSHPTWPTSGTVADGSVTWTEINYDSVFGYGCVDSTVLRHLDPSGNVVQGECTWAAGEAAVIHGNVSPSDFFADDNGDRQSELCVGQGSGPCVFYNPLGSSTPTLQADMAYPANSSGIMPGAAPMYLGGGFDTLALELNRTDSIALGRFQLKDYTFSGLPSCTVAGQEVYVTDAIDPGIGLPIVAGGGSGVAATCDGTNWVSSSGTVPSTSGPSVRVVSTGSTDSLLAADCGNEVLYDNAAYTVTIPAGIVPASGSLCPIKVRTATANKVSVNGGVSGGGWVQGSQALVTGSGSSITLTLTSPVGTGDALLCAAVYDTPSGSVTPSASDNGSPGDNYSVIDQATFNPGSGAGLVTLAAFNITGAPTQITFSMGSATGVYRNLGCDEYKAVSGVDGTAHAIKVQSAPGSGTDAITSGAVTPSDAADIAWGVTVSYSTLSSTAGTGYTSRTHDMSGGAWAYHSEDKTLGSLSAIPATFTSANGEGQWATGVVALINTAAATLVSADSYTGTQAVAGSGISLDLTTIGGVPTAYLDGHGS